MKDLQGMVRSLIGTVADQHDATEELKKKLHEKPAGPPPPLINKPVQMPAIAQEPHKYENTMDNKYGHLAPGPAQSLAAGRAPNTWATCSQS